jgi:hypothetical protein
MGAVAGPAAIVLAAPLARTWDHDPESLNPHLVDVLRAGLVVVVPVLGIAAVAGDELIEFVLGGSFSASDADLIVGTFLAMSGMVLATIALPVPALAAYASSRYLAVGMIAAAGLAVHVAASFVAVDIGLAALGGAASLASIVSFVLVLALVWRAGWPRALAVVVQQVVPVAAVGAVAFGTAGAIGAVLGAGGWDAVAAAAGSVAMLLLARALLPEYWDVARRMAEPLRGWRTPKLL